MTGSCVFGNCFHGDEDHEEGICWKIVISDLEDKKTTQKYCQCKQGDVIRRYEHPKMGYMEVGTNDLMITNKCQDCGVDVLLFPGNTLCMYCRDKPGHYKPVNVHEYVMARLLLSPSGGVAIGIDSAIIQ